MTTKRKQYKISELLTNSVQPFEDLDQEMLNAIAQGMGEQAVLAVPIVITSDGVLIDGHQRLKALQQQGRVEISSDDVRVIESATKENALEWSVRLNVQRRHLSVEQQASKALELRSTKKWSDAKIAELFGVSGMTVGRWLKGAPKPDVVVGVDGVMQPSTGKSNEAMRTAGENRTVPRAHPWSGDGTVLRAVVRLGSDLNEMLTAAGDPENATAVMLTLPQVDDLGQANFDFCKIMLQELRRTIVRVLDEMDKPVPAKPKTPPTKAVLRTIK